MPPQLRLLQMVYLFMVLVIALEPFPIYAAQTTITPTGAAIGGPRAPIATLSGVDKSIMCLESIDYSANTKDLELAWSATRDAYTDAQNLPLTATRFENKSAAERLSKSLMVYQRAVEKQIMLEVAAETLYIGARLTGRNGGNTSAVPDLIYGNVFWGLDVSFQEFEDTAPGSGLSLKYNFGSQVNRYTKALRQVRATQVGHQEKQEDVKKLVFGVGDYINYLKEHPAENKPLTLYLHSFPGFLTAKGSTPSTTLQESERLAATLLTTPPPDGEADSALREALVDYTLAPQSSFYITGRSYIGQGNFSAEGITIGRLLPVHQGAIYASALAQAVQFKPSTPSTPNRSDGQYGFVVFWQNKVNGYERDKEDKSDEYSKDPKINLWDYKVGAEYFSKALGQPDTYDFFVRYRFIPSYVEVTPYYGRAGIGRREFFGVNFGVTIPVSF